MARTSKRKGEGGPGAASGGWRGAGRGSYSSGEVHQGREEEVSFAPVCVRGVEVERHTVGDREARHATEFGNPLPPVGEAQVLFQRPPLRRVHSQENLQVGVRDRGAGWEV